MKRDTNLMLTILREVEKSARPISGANMEIPGYDRKQLYEHARLAEEQGFVGATLASDETNFVQHRLTAVGHGFLEIHETAR